MRDPIIIAIIAGVATIGAGGGVYSALTIRAQRRHLTAQADKADAETVTLIGTTAVQLLAPLREEIAAVRAEAGQVRTQLRRALEQIDALTEIVRRWRRAILADETDLAQLREMVRADRDAADLRNGKH